MSGEGGDFSMFGLFQQEVQTHGAAIEQAFASYRDEPAKRESLEAISNAAGSIKGAALIVGVAAAGDLAAALESRFAAASRHNQSAGPGVIEAAVAILEIIQSIAAAPESDALAWHENNREALQKALADFNAAQDASADSDPQTPADAKAAPPAKSASFEIADLSMLDLFKQEAETHSRALGEGLLELEKDPKSPTLIEPLMRAAHSVKGAARIVGLSPVVELAHAMEDGFVAAQKGEFLITAGHIDLFLMVNDLFIELAEVPEDGYEKWLNDKAGEFQSLAKTVRDGQSVAPEPDATPAGQPPVAAPAEVKAEVNAPSRPAAQKPAEDAPKKTAEQAEKVRDVRVSAKILGRLMGLAGESVVESKRLGAFSENILSLRKDIFRLSNLLESAKISLDSGETREHIGISLAEAARQTRLINEAFSEHFIDFESYSTKADDLANRLYNRVLSSRMRPFGEGAQGFPRMVRDLARELGKKVRFEILGENTAVDRDVLKKLEAPLNHIVRNALDHGLESPDERGAAGKDPTGGLTMEARHQAGMLSIAIRDDGRGIDVENIRDKVVERKMLDPEMAAELRHHELLEFLMLPGFSTAKSITKVSGRGVGLDVVQNMIQEVRGTITIDSAKGAGTTFLLKLPLSLSVISALFVDIGGETFALPLHKLDRIFTCAESDIQNIENREYVSFEGENIGLISAAQVLDLDAPPTDNRRICVVVISDGNNTYGLTVDSFVEERDISVRPLDPRLDHVQDVGAAAILEDGRVILILDVDDMVRSVDNILSGGRLNRIRAAKEAAAAKRKRILVVDDSITVREVQRQLLESRGFSVSIAIDGIDGLNALRCDEFDLVISDVDMPRMNGIEMVRRIREDDALKEMPVMIVSYKDRPEDRARGIEAGANHYLVKSSFHDETLMETVVELIGKE